MRTVADPSLSAAFISTTAGSSSMSIFNASPASRACSNDSQSQEKAKINWIANVAHLGCPVQELGRAGSFMAFRHDGPQLILPTAGVRHDHRYLQSVGTSVKMRTTPLSIASAADVSMLLIFPCATSERTK